MEKKNLHPSKQAQEEVKSEMTEGTMQAPETESVPHAHEENNTITYGEVEGDNDYSQEEIEEVVADVRKLLSLKATQKESSGFMVLAIQDENDATIFKGSGITRNIPKAQVLDTFLKAINMSPMDAAFI